jgi:hypothetical protein
MNFTAAHHSRQAGPVNRSSPVRRSIDVGGGHQVIDTQAGQLGGGTGGHRPEPVPHNIEAPIAPIEEIRAAQHRHSAAPTSQRAADAAEESAAAAPAEERAGVRARRQDVVAPKAGERVAVAAEESAVVAAAEEPVDARAGRQESSPLKPATMSPPAPPSGAPPSSSPRSTGCSLRRSRRRSRTRPLRR